MTMDRARMPYRLDSDFRKGKLEAKKLDKIIQVGSAQQCPLSRYEEATLNGNIGQSFDSPCLPRAIRRLSVQSRAQMGLFTLHTSAAGTAKFFRSASIESKNDNSEADEQK